jgi:hypothetical protein
MLSWRPPLGRAAARCLCPSRLVLSRQPWQQAPWLHLRRSKRRLAQLRHPRLRAPARHRAVAAAGLAIFSFLASALCLGRGGAIQHWRRQAMPRVACSRRCVPRRPRYSLSTGRCSAFSPPARKMIRQCHFHWHERRSKVRRQRLAVLRLPRVLPLQDVRRLAVRLVPRVARLGGRARRRQLCSKAALELFPFQPVPGAAAAACQHLRRRASGQFCRGPSQLLVPLIIQFLGRLAFRLVPCSKAALVLLLPLSLPVPATAVAARRCPDLRTTALVLRLPTVLMQTCRWTLRTALRLLRLAALDMLPVLPVPAAAAAARRCLNPYATR